MDRQKLKERAKESLNGKYSECIKLLLAYFGISFLIGFITGIFSVVFKFDQKIAVGVSELISLVISCVLIFGVISFFLKISRNEKVDYKELFSKKDLFRMAIGLSIIVSLLVSLWTLLLIIPGIIASISYSQAMYISLDNPNMSVMECIRESKRIMNGHKMDYFVLQLSFMGWMLLIPFTFGLVMFYVYPYMMVTDANFYNELISKK